MKRRLAAILSADVVGYSRLMGLDETGTFEALRSHLDDLVMPSVARHDGRIFKLMGDGLLAEFNSVFGAVQTAVDIQQGMGERNSGTSPSDAIRFRIGINVGEVIVEGDDLFGDGVNIAGRLQAFAGPGEICLSADAHRQIRTRPGLAFADLGEHTLKNISEPLRIYRVRLPGGDMSPPPGKAVEELLAGPAIAVLPFANMSGDPEQEYFSDGLTDDLITALTSWRSFAVIARNSCFVYKHRAIDVRQVARELSARYLLEGGVRKSGTRVRITAQLVDAMTGHHIWADKFDRNLDDVFALQDEISRCIAAVIEPALTAAELRRSLTKHPSSLDAWDYYLRGIYKLHQFTKESNEQARQEFIAAISLDPTYSRAHSGLAWTYSRDLLLGFCDNKEVAVAKVFEAARRAVALDDQSSLTHHLLSTAYIWRNEHELALAEGRRAVDLNPSDAEAIHGLGNKLDLAGDPEGVRLMEQAQQLNPQDPQRHMYLTFLARAHAAAGTHEAAVACARQAIQRRPDYPNAYYVLAIALGHLGQSAEAGSALERCRQLNPELVSSRSSWAPYTDPQRNEYLREGVRKAQIAQ